MNNNQPSKTHATPTADNAQKMRPWIHLTTEKKIELLTHYIVMLLNLCYSGVISSWVHPSFRQFLATQFQVEGVDYQLWQFMMGRRELILSLANRIIGQNTSGVYIENEPYIIKDTSKIKFEFLPCWFELVNAQEGLVFEAPKTTAEPPKPVAELPKPVAEPPKPEEFPVMATGGVVGDPNAINIAPATPNVWVKKETVTELSKEDKQILARSDEVDTTNVKKAIKQETAKQIVAVQEQIEEIAAKMADLADKFEELQDLKAQLTLTLDMV